jgi:phospholipase A-2-activating protein
MTKLTVSGMQKKIEELNAQLVKNGQKDLSLNPTDLSVLQKVISHLSASGATSTSQTVSGGLDLAIKLVTQWPYADRLPGLDLLRLLAVAPQTATYVHPRGGNIVDLLTASVTEEHPPKENHVMMAIRAFVNLFESAEGRVLAGNEFERIQSLASDSLGGGKSSNRNLLVALTTLYINYAVLLTSSEAQGDAFEHPVTILSSLSQILTSASDSEVVYRALVALGTLLALGEEVRSAAIEVYGLDEVVKRRVGKAADPRIKNVGREIGVLFKR